MSPQQRRLILRLILMFSIGIALGMAIVTFRNGDYWWTVWFLALSLSGIAVRIRLAVRDAN